MLQGLRVLDLTRVLAGPYGTMLLADLGADVVKVEDPKGGDPTRVIGGGPDSPYFVAVNRNKRSIALDLKTKDGRALLARLAAKADVLWHNFRPGAAKKLGCDVEAFRAANPRLVTCAITSFGATGPYRDLPAFDLVIQAMSGAMSATGEPGGAPCRHGIPTGDLAGGLFAAVGTLAALHERATTGKGRDIDLSLLDCSVSLLTYMAQFTLAGQKSPAPQGSSHSYNVPYRAYRCSDGKFVAVSIFTPKFWKPFCDAMGLPRLADDHHFSDPASRRINRAALDALLEAEFAKHPRDWWVNHLWERELPIGPVYDVAEALHDEQVRARGMVSHLSDGREALGSPFGETKLKRPPEVDGDREGVVRDWLGGTEKKDQL
ncbi:MAG: CoA transferase [Planctomycetes bacterium]|nr:CoA transferase [Planctomycetota bacterium]